MADTNEFKIFPTGQQPLKVIGELIAESKGDFVDDSGRLKKEEINLYLSSQGKYVVERKIDHGEMTETRVEITDDKDRLPKMLGYSDAANDVYSQIEIETFKVIE